MSIQKTMQLGGGEPVPQAILELQQLALGMFLIWDALGDGYTNHALVEQAALADWARKYRINRKHAIEALMAVKQRYMEEPWAHYIHCRDFQAEGWANAVIFAPASNADMFEQIKTIAERRPFKGPIGNGAP
jgi:hypothetical protein